MIIHLRMTTIKFAIELGHSSVALNMPTVKSEVFSAILDDAILKSLGTKFAATSAIFALSTKSMLVALEILLAHF